MLYNLSNTYLPIDWPKGPQIDTNAKILFMGSCFAERIGFQLANENTRIEVNPLGIMYNPITLNRNLVFNTQINESDIISVPNKGFCHWDFHGKFRANSRELLIQKLNQEIQQTKQILNKIDYLFLTWGNAWSWTLIEHERLVGNCHKQPHQNFRRSLLELDQIIEDAKNTFSQLKRQNPNLKIIVTISPVRHLKKKAVEDRWGKSTLSLAVHHLLKNEILDFYFPAYEIMVDQLRDYQFYKKDRIQPNDKAERIIYEFFKKWTQLQ